MAAMKDHLKYILKNATSTLGSQENILETAKKIDTRVDARVALKLCIAVPNDGTPQLWLPKVRDFLSRSLDIPQDNFFLALHTTHKLGKELGTTNHHIHIIANTITRQNKKIRLNKKDLSDIHKAWDNLLSSEGYDIKREKQGESLGKLSWIDFARNKEKYKEYLNTKKQIKEVDQKMKMSVQRDTDIKQYPTEFKEKEDVEIEDIVKQKFYSNIIWDNGQRKGQNAKEITAIILDIDATDTIERVQETLGKKGLESYIVTTKSHTPEKHRFRVIIEIREKITDKKDLQLYKDACTFLTQDLEIHADNTFDLARMYAPSPSDAEITYIKGEPLNFVEYIKKAKQKQKTMKEIAFHQEQMQKKVSKAATTHNESSNWLYADVQGIMQINIKKLIKHFEGISREWNAGTETYIRTLAKEKIAINEKENIAFSFSKMQGWGVMRYLFEKTGERNINNLARILEKNGFGSFLKIDEKIFDQNINEALNQSANFQELVENLKEKFKVKSVFIDMQKQKIKIAGIEKDINLDYVLQTLNFKTNKYNLTLKR
ncbi:MAG: MobA/MobL family protein [candidate division WOR-3 bacterium]